MRGRKSSGCHWLKQCLFCTCQLKGLQAIQWYGRDKSLSLWCVVLFGSLDRHRLWFWIPALGATSTACLMESKNWKLTGCEGDSRCVANIIQAVLEAFPQQLLNGDSHTNEGGDVRGAAEGYLEALKYGKSGRRQELWRAAKRHSLFQAFSWHMTQCLSQFHMDIEFFWQRKEPSMHSVVRILASSFAFPRCEGTYKSWMWYLWCESPTINHSAGRSWNGLLCKSEISKGRTSWHLIPHFGF